MQNFSRFLRAVKASHVVKNIQKGRTTQAEIKVVFGPPDMLTKAIRFG